MKKNEEEKILDIDGDPSFNKNELTANSLEDDFSFVESTEDGDALPAKDMLKKLREELKVCRKEKEEYLTGWQRAKADYVNLQNEYRDSSFKNSILVKEKFVNNLLSVLDSFDMAFSDKDSWEKVDSGWRSGVEYIYQQLIKGLSSSGVEKINEVDVVFNPNFHESIGVVETKEKSKNHFISSVIQTGYKIGDRVIRPARVNLYEYKE